MLGSHQCNCVRHKRIERKSLYCNNLSGEDAEVTGLHFQAWRAEWLDFVLGVNKCLRID